MRPVTTALIYQLLEALPRFAVAGLRFQLHRRHDNNKNNNKMSSIF